MLSSGVALSPGTDRCQQPTAAAAAAGLRLGLVAAYCPFPLPQILDFFADPTYVSEFHASLFATGYSAGPGTAAGVPDLLSLWNAYAKKGIAHGDTSWAGCTVPEQLKASGLSEERFRGDGEKGSYAALPGVALNLAIRKQVGNKSVS